MENKSVWLIEKVDASGRTDAYLWAEPDGKFWWAEAAQDVYHGALRFSREIDALSFVSAVRQLQQALPYRDIFHGLVNNDEGIRVAEHRWMEN